MHCERHCKGGLNQSLSKRAVQRVFWRVDESRRRACEKRDTHLWRPLRVRRETNKPLIVCIHCIAFVVFIHCKEKRRVQIESSKRKESTWSGQGSGRAWKLFTLHHCELNELLTGNDLLDVWEMFGKCGKCLWCIMCVSV